MKKLQEKVKQNIQNKWKEYQDIINKKLEKTQKQLNELREDFNRLPNETKENIKKEIYKIKMIAQDIKEEFNKDVKNLRKKEPCRNPEK
jgi:ferritin-like metal-binding protein YciE